MPVTAFGYQLRFGVSTSYLADQQTSSPDPAYSF